MKFLLIFNFSKCLQTCYWQSSYNSPKWKLFPVEGVTWWLKYIRHLMYSFMATFYKMIQTMRSNVPTGRYKDLPVGTFTKLSLKELSIVIKLFTYFRLRHDLFSFCISGTYFLLQTSMFWLRVGTYSFKS